MKALLIALVLTLTSITACVTPQSETADGWTCLETKDGPALCAEERSE